MYSHLSMNAHHVVGLASLIITLLAVAVASAPAMAQRFNLQDALLSGTLALPNGAGAVTGAAIDTGISTADGVQPGAVEYLLTAPTLTTGELANAATMTYDIITSPNANLSSPTTLMPGVLVQTGAGGAGAASATYTFRLPPEAARYVGIRATNSGTGNCSVVSATLGLFV